LPRPIGVFVGGHPTRRLIEEIVACSLRLGRACGDHSVGRGIGRPVAQRRHLARRFARAVRIDEIALFVDIRILVGIAEVRLVVRFQLPSGSLSSVSNFSTGRRATALRMNAAKARAGAVPPWRPGTARASSRPIHTPVVIPLEKPEEPAVLVRAGGARLAATGRPDLRRAPGAGADRVCSRSVIPAAT
jgi:hypothetical protein